ncbi:transport and Golgi organization protein 1 homolog isoform X2 [Cavia porcellus]|uniref:transport and Golgi organization protein 1 homolog isoform X2 n=1 Tax=Cavia porcellus TaxID=10141 RepID=UPI000661EB2E|nr:transport and Golgi organization protein 1 homolog isoform X2 [Cavia porcellus]
MDAVSATGLGVTVSQGFAKLLRPLQMLYAALEARLLRLVATLPEHVQPRPDFYGLPWKPVLFTACLGIVSLAIFFWRTVLAVKERTYQVTEQQIAEKLKNTTKDSAELVKKVSSYKQKIEESKKLILETKEKNSHQTIKYKAEIKVLEERNKFLTGIAKTVGVIFKSERKRNVQNQDLLADPPTQYKGASSESKQRDLRRLGKLRRNPIKSRRGPGKSWQDPSQWRWKPGKVWWRPSNVWQGPGKLPRGPGKPLRKSGRVRQDPPGHGGTLLEQEAEDREYVHAELSEEIRSLEMSQRHLEATLAHKDDRIRALTNCIIQLNQFESGSESEGPGPGRCEPGELANGEVGGEESKLKTGMNQLMDVSGTQAKISVLREELKLLQVKPKASLSANYDLKDQIKKLNEDCGMLQAAKAGLEEECRMLQQKVEILKELYQENEMELQKKLIQEELELQERDQWLSAPDEKVVLATEEVKVYKQRIHEIEQELEKTERSFKNQLAIHEEKAHENLVKAWHTERLIAKEKREATSLRHRLLEMTEKLAMSQEEPVIGKPMPDQPGVQNAPRRDPGPGPVANSDSRGSSLAKGMDNGKSHAWAHHLA